MRKLCGYKAIQLLASGVGLASLAVSACADVAAPNLDEARRLLEAGHAEQSAALLERNLVHFAGNTDYDLLLGLAQYRAGRSGQAQFAFERVLMVAPENVEARLKLAQIVIERGSTRLLDDLLQPLTTHQLNAEQQRQLESLRAQAAVSESSRLSGRGYVQGGIGWDGNVTSGPDQQSLIFPALGTEPLSLGNAARDADHVATLEAGTTWVGTLDENTWLTGTGILRVGDNRTRRDVRESFVNLDLGILRRIGDEYVGTSLTGQDYQVAGATYRKTRGLRLNWIHPLDGSSWLTGYVQSLDFEYPGQSSDNAARRVVGVTLDSIREGGAATMQFGVYGGEENAKDGANSPIGFRQAGVQLAGRMRLNEDWSISAGAVYEQRRHQAEDALYGIFRNDKQLSMIVAADYRIGGRWHLIPQYSYSRNSSSTELYDFTRKTFMLHLRWEFDNAKK
ncbi:MAG: DUF560 domain-containing protein [Sulfuricella sp.]|nr:DUF560 domain-containing protein [Sulfuricella sp.]